MGDVIKHQRRQRQVMPSEQGLLEMAERRLDLPLGELFVSFRDLVSADMDWIDSRKKRFRRRASLVKISSVLLAAASTVILGIQEIPSRASVALPFVALVTALGTVETFFSWRSRWVLMEEALYRLNRLRDDMDFYLVTAGAAQLDVSRLEEFYTEQQSIWAEVSRRWIEFRKLDVAQPPDRDGGQHPAV